MIVIKRIVIARIRSEIVRMMLRIAKTHPCVPFQDGTWSTSMLGCEEDDAEEGRPSVEVEFVIKKSF